MSALLFVYFLIIQPGNEASAAASGPNCPKLLISTVGPCNTVTTCDFAPTPSLRFSYLARAHRDHRALARLLSRSRVDIGLRQALGSFCTHGFHHLFHGCIVVPPVLHHFLWKYKWNCTGSRKSATAAEATAAQPEYHSRCVPSCVADRPRKSSLSSCVSVQLFGCALRCLGSIYHRWSDVHALLESPTREHVPRDQFVLPRRFLSPEPAPLPARRTISPRSRGLQRIRVPARVLVRVPVQISRAMVRTGVSSQHTPDTRSSRTHTAG